MKVINFSHPLTPDQIQTIENLSGQKVNANLHIECHLDLVLPLADQVRTLVDQAGLTPESWQAEPIIICPPSLGGIACALLAEVHGRMGHFPPLVRIGPIAGSIPTRYAVVELLNLDEIREKARMRRGTGTHVKEQPG